MRGRGVQSAAPQQWWAAPCDVQGGVQTRRKRAPLKRKNAIASPYQIVSDLISVTLRYRVIVSQRVG